MKSTVHKAAGLIAAAVLLVALMPFSAHADAEGDWEYRIDGKSAAITKYKGSDANPATPSTLGGQPVTGIANDAFNGCAIITLTLSAGIQTVEPGAFFECRTVTEFKVDGGNKVFTVTNGVLFRDGGKTLVQYPAGKTDASYAIPEGVAEIAGSAFDHNTFLAAITIPESVIEIGQGAFWRNSALKTIRIPAAVAAIGNSAFANCGALTAIEVDERNKNYRSEAGVLLTKDGKRLVQCPPGLAGHYTVPDGVTALDEGSFRGDFSLTGVTVGGGVKSIGNCAFAFCESLETVIIGEGMDSVGSMAFQGCGMLQSVYFKGAPPSAFEPNAFDSCAQNLTVYYPESEKKAWSKFKVCSAKPYTELPKPAATPTPQPTATPTTAPAPTTPGAQGGETQPLGRPKLLSAAESGSAGIRLVWTPVPGAAYYVVYRSTAYLGKYERIGTSRSSACIASAAAEGKRRCYKVQAVCRSGGQWTGGGYSNIVYGSRTPLRQPG